MLKITQKGLKDPLLRQSLGKIYNSPKFSPKKARSISRRVRKINEECKTTDEMYDKLIQKYAVKNEQGEVLPLEGGAPGTFKIEEGQEDAFEQECAEVSDVEVELQDGFTMDELEVVGDLSPAHIGALEPLIMETRPSR